MKKLCGELSTERLVEMALMQATESAGVSGLANGVPGEDEQVTKHILSCASCRTRWERIVSDRKRLDLAVASIVRGDSKHAASKTPSLSAQPPASGAPSRTSRPVVALVAAALVAAVGVGVWSGSESNEDDLRFARDATSITRWRAPTEPLSRISWPMVGWTDPQLGQSAFALSALLDDEARGTDDTSGEEKLP